MPFQKIFSKICMTFHCEAVIEILDNTVAVERDDMGVEGNPQGNCKLRRQEPKPRVSLTCR